MIRISKITDYAFTIILVLAQKIDDIGDITLESDDSRQIRLDQNIFNVAEIAQLSMVPVPTVSKILQHLTKAGLVESLRGAQGGYKLCKDLAQISVGEIIEIFEGPIALTACNSSSINDGDQDNSNVDCALGAACRVSSRWKVINQHVKDVFFSHNMADMCD